MSEQTTTALTAEQVADFHDRREAQQGEILAAAVDSWPRVSRPLPPCFACRVTPTEINLSVPDDGADADALTLTFTDCGHAFHADSETLAAGLRLHNARRHVA